MSLDVFVSKRFPTAGPATIRFFFVYTRRRSPPPLLEEKPANKGGSMSPVLRNRICFPTFHSEQVLSSLKNSEKNNAETPEPPDLLGFRKGWKTVSEVVFYVKRIGKGVKE